MHSAGIVTPLAPWFPDAAAIAQTRRRLGRAPRLFLPHEPAWRAVAPSFGDVVRLAKGGLPFQIAAERRYDRAGRLERLRPALAAGKTVFLPQIHQVLPRVMRLIVALRTAFFGAGREECSFLFLVDGRGREGLGLHHDGDVASFWLQLEGRRTVTLGPPVHRRTPQELPDGEARRPGFTTRDLPPGSLLYLPPRTPHRVVCYGRSLALSLTWSTKRAHAARTSWDVVAGRVAARLRDSRAYLWTQVPVSPRMHGRGVRLTLPDDAALDIPSAGRRVVTALAMMARFEPRTLGRALPILLEHGVVAPVDLPQALVADRPADLDGWRFA